MFIRMTLIIILFIHQMGMRMGILLTWEDLHPGAYLFKAPGPLVPQFCKFRPKLCCLWSRNKLWELYSPSTTWLHLLVVRSVSYKNGFCVYRMSAAMLCTSRECLSRKPLCHEKDHDLSILRLSGDGWYIYGLHCATWWSHGEVLLLNTPHYSFSLRNTTHVATYAHTHIPTHAHTHTGTPHTYLHMHTHTYPHTHTHTHTGTRHTYPHTYTHTGTPHTYPHTHRNATHTSGLNVVFDHFWYAFYLVCRSTGLLVSWLLCLFLCYWLVPLH